jgi:hypothetical protein
MREDGLVAHVPGRRRYSSYEGEVTPAPDNLVNRDFTAPAPNVKMAHGHHAGSRPVTARSTFPDDRLLRRINWTLGMLIIAFPDLLDGKRSTIKIRPTGGRHAFCLSPKKLHD